MTQRRLPSSIRPQKKQQSFWGVFLFIVCVGITSGFGIYYFLKKQLTLDTPIAKEIQVDLEDTGIPIIPKTSEENREESALIDDLYKTSEVVQLYRAQDSSSKNYDYWRYSLHKKGPESSCAIIITGTDNLGKKDIKRLESMRVPLTVLSSIENKPSWSFVCPIKIKNDLSFEDMGKDLDHQINDRSCIGVISSDSYSSLTLEMLLMHLKQRGLVFIEDAQVFSPLLEDVSYKTLALSLKTEKEASQRKIKGKKLIAFSVENFLSPKGRRWIESQKKQGVHFVRLDQLF